jgi:hypothetical protein
MGSRTKAGTRQSPATSLLLVQWGLLGAGTGAALARLHTMYPDLQGIVLSGHPEARQHTPASGADAFVSKADALEKMLKTLRATRARVRLTSRAGALPAPPAAHRNYHRGKSQSPSWPRAAIDTDDRCAPQVR